MEARIRAIEEELKPKAAQIKEVVEIKVEKLGSRSPINRRNYMDVFSATSPDPVDVGLAAECGPIPPERSRDRWTVEILPGGRGRDALP
jgi:hypothetical protein